MKCDIINWIMWSRGLKQNLKRFQAIFLAGSFLFLLSGCGEEFPALTQEEYDLIVDYSAGVLSKYSTTNGDKLTRIAPPAPEEELAELPADEQKQETVKPAAKPAPAKQEKKEEPVEEPAEEPSEQPNEEPKEDNEDAIIVNSGDNGTGDEEPSEEPAIAEAPVEDGGSAASPGEVEVSDSDLLKRLQSGVRVDLNGYYVLNSYPEGAGDSNLAIRADAGNKLLILSFSLTNETSGPIDVDYLSKAPSFTLFINGEPVSRNMTTLLDNEMSTYASALESGETKGSVLCFQIKEAQAKTIDTLSVRMNCFGEEQMLRVE